MPRLMDKSGFTLTEVVIAAGLMGLIALGAAQIFNYVAQSQVGVTNRNDVSQLESAIEQYVDSSSNCGIAFATPTSTTLTPQEFPIPGSTSPNIKNVPGFPPEIIAVLRRYSGYGTNNTAVQQAIKLQPSVDLQETNSNCNTDPTVPATALDPGCIGQKLRIRTLRISNKGVSGVAVTTDAGPSTRYVASLRLVVEMLSNFPVTPPQKPQWRALPTRYYEFPVTVPVGPPVPNTAGPYITGCSASDNNNEGATAANLCTGLGFSYDKGTGVCTPKSGCNFGGGYSISTCYPPASGPCPGSVVNPMTNDYTCPPGYLVNRGGFSADNYTDDCGKKCSVNVMVVANFYQCLQCPP